MNAFWGGLSRSARLGLMVGTVVIILAAAVTSWWLLRTDYQVLFTDLKPQDASAMTAELDRLKVPYQLGDGGTVILVDKAVVHATRIKLMGKELPLHGAVGFELFNNTDFGMTEFAQKINYQRALQGELTRTILSLSEIRDVRVHLALPEQGLFKQATSKSKAAINLTMRQGQVLRGEQVTGIQRLVAAAVPGMTVQDVTIVDNQGVALSRSNGDGETEANSTRMELKRETENYLSRKVGVVLERVFGPGQAMATVDVSLNMDQVRVTTEDVLPALGEQARNSLPPAGVVVRERESLRDVGAPLDTKVSEAGSVFGARAGGNTQREVEYQVGRRVEQVVSQPGSIRRIQVVAVVRKSLSIQQEEQLRKMVAAAVGASFDRGDAVVVQTLAAMAAQPGTSPIGNGGLDASVQDIDNLQDSPSAVVPTRAQSKVGESLSPVALALVGVILTVAFLGLAAGYLFRPASNDHLTKALSESQRQSALRQVQAWMRQDTTHVAASPVTSESNGGAE